MQEIAENCTGIQSTPDSDYVSECPKNRGQSYQCLQILDTKLTTSCGECKNFVGDTHRDEQGIILCSKGLESTICLIVGFLVI